MSYSRKRGKDEVPKQTFFNLPEEKKATLIRAARKEFSRVPLNDALIANIVKGAGVSRGSFYQYFEDKDDLYFYLLDKNTEDRWAVFVSELKKHDGDLFAAMTGMFYSTLSLINEKDTRDFYSNMFLNMNYKIEKTFKHTVKLEEFNKQMSNVLPLIQIEDLHAANNEELFHMLQITMTIMIQALMLKFAQELSDEEAAKHFELQLKLVKRGFIK